MSKNVHIRVSEDFLAMLRKVSTENNKSMTDVIIEAVRTKYTPTMNTPMNTAVNTPITFQDTEKPLGALLDLGLKKERKLSEEDEKQLDKIRETLERLKTENPGRTAEDFLNDPETKKRLNAIYRDEM